MHAALIEFRTTTPYPVQLANELGRLCRITLLLPQVADGFAHNVDRAAVDLQFFHMPRYREPANLAMVRDLRRRLKILNPDLLHITFRHWWGTPGLGLLAPLPMVATVHDVNPHPGDGGWLRNPGFLYPLQWRWARQVIVHSSADRRKLLSQYGWQPDRVTVLPIGAYNFYRAWSRDDRGERPNTVLFFGRIWDYKGLDLLIEAEPLISREIPNVRIVIAGYGEPIDKYLQAMVNPDRFEVLNHHIPDETVAELFQLASVVAVPYREASQSGVISIAYVFGKPVVASSVGGIPDVVEHGKTGYLVPPGDRYSLAEAIVALLKDRETRLEMGERALEKARSDLSWVSIAEKTLRIYKKALTSA